MQTSPVFEWISQHLQLIGWPTLIYAAYRVGRFFSRLESRALALEEHVTKVVVNDIPHIEVAVNAILQALVSLRDDIRDFVLRR